VDGSVEAGGGQEVKEYVAPGVIGAGLFALGWFQYRKVRASRGWPCTGGRIVSGRVETGVESGGDDGADTTSYYPALQYEYQVDGRTYRGNDIAFNQRTYSSQKQAEAALRVYPEGVGVQVYYDPRQPGRAVLERKASAGTALMVIGGLILGLMAAAMIKG
jgi:hypothetical protein